MEIQKGLKAQLWPESLETTEPMCSLSCVTAGIAFTYTKQWSCTSLLCLVLKLLLFQNIIKALFHRVNFKAHISSTTAQHHFVDLPKLWHFMTKNVSIDVRRSWLSFHHYLVLPQNCLNEAKRWLRKSLFETLSTSLVLKSCVFTEPLVTLL